VSYRFEGFFSPPDGTGLNRVKAGSSVPVKFQLHRADGPETSPDAVTKATVSRIDCVTRSHLGVTASGPPGDAVKWAESQLFFGWRTESAWAGTCQRLTLTFADGLTQSVLFQLT
jgi:hypothetical protein